MIDEFKSMQNQIKVKPTQDEDEDYGDELQDQMADALFKEADDLGILEQVQQSEDEYSKALRKIEDALKNKPQTDEKIEEKKKSEIDADKDFGDNDLYDQVIEVDQMENFSPEK